MVRIVVVLLFLGLCAAATQASAAGTEAKAEPALSVVGKHDGDRPEDFRFRMGEAMQIKVTAAAADPVAAAWARSKTQALVLYFDGIRIAGLSAPPTKLDDGQLLLNFPLLRNAEDDASRTAWDSLLKSKHSYLMAMAPSLGVGDDLPMAVHSEPALQFYVASGTVILLTLGGGLVILVLAYVYLVRGTTMLFDQDSQCFSLGKSQMAFWGLVVLLSFVGVWIVTGTMEHIPPQVLILLGISGATGLGSVVIGNNKTSALANQVADKTESKNALDNERQQLEADAAPADAIRLAAVKAAIDAHERAIADATAQLRPGRSKGFWRDICDDGNGLSFHRLQVVAWTLVLGVVFIRSVAQVMSMPEFSETLLSLLGISNATYLGFKIPEKP